MPLAPTSQRAALAPLMTTARAGLAAVAVAAVAAGRWDVALLVTAMAVGLLALAVLARPAPGPELLLTGALAGQAAVSWAGIAEAQPWRSPVAHLVVAALAASALAGSERLPAARRPLLAVVVVMLMGGAWELLEAASDLLLGTAFVPGAADTALDLGCNLAGASLGAVAVRAARSPGRLAAALGAGILLVAVGGPPAGPARPPGAAAAACAPGDGRVLWGAYVDGDADGLGDPPWDMRALDRFESVAGKRVGIVHFGQPWMDGGVPSRFPLRALRAVYRRGAVPMVDWSPWDLALDGNGPEQPRFALRRIIAGEHDRLIRSWARSAARWGRPMMVRMGHEMNGDWYPWSERANGNRPGEFARAWRHVRRVFGREGAGNVTWVWAVNAVYPGSIPLRRLFPGRAQVDWVAIDAYNFGRHPDRPDRWRSLSEVAGPTYRQLRRLARGKPVMLSEFASTEIGGDKAEWITAALAGVPREFPAVRAVSWFNWDADGFDWRIQSSAAASAAFRAGIAAPVYADGAGGRHRGPGGVIPPTGC